VDTNLELQLIKFLLDQKNFNYYTSFAQGKLERLSSSVRDVITGINDYVKDTNPEVINLNDFSVWYNTIAHPNISDSKAAEIESICSKVEQLSLPDENIFKDLSIRHWAMSISDLAYEVTLGKKSMEDVEQAVQAYVKEVKHQGKQYSFIENDSLIFDQLEERKNADKYSWSIPELELMMGQICKGDFIIVGSRPDGGKTTFLSTQAVHFAKQLKEGESILWFNNEEAVSKVRSRQIQAALKWTTKEIEQDIEKSLQLFNSKLGDGVINIYDDNAMTIYDIQNIVEQTKPRIIIIDQLWKLGGMEKLQGIERFAKLSQFIRDLAKEHAPIIATTQLDGSADNVKYPSMGSLYNSKTSVQGEADCILTIGQQPEEDDIRYFRCPKNKLSYADPKFRSAGCSVKIDKEKAQLISLIGTQHHVR